MRSLVGAPTATTMWQRCCRLSVWRTGYSFEHDSELRVKCSDPSLSNQNNLAWKAASALRQAAGYRGGARIWIEKGIPAAMGLGGGSSNAGAALVALNRLWDIGMSTTELEELARTLGSDVPFFIKGGTALGTERGDVLRALKPLAQRCLCWCALKQPATEKLRECTTCSEDRHTRGVP